MTTKSVSINTLYEVAKGHNGLEVALEQMIVDIEKAVDEGANIIILSDRGVSREKAPIPMLLACSHAHHGLKRLKKRSMFGIIIESAEPREPHHFHYSLDMVPVPSTPTWSTKSSPIK